MPLLVRARVAATAHANPRRHVATTTRPPRVRDTVAATAVRPRRRRGGRGRPLPLGVRLGHPGGWGEHHQGSVVGLTGSGLGPRWEHPAARVDPRGPAWTCVDQPRVGRSAGRGPRERGQVTVLQRLRSSRSRGFLLRHLSLPPQGVTVPVIPNAPPRSSRCSAWPASVSSCRRCTSRPGPHRSSRRSCGSPYPRCRSHNGGRSTAPPPSPRVSAVVGKRVVASLSSTGTSFDVAGVSFDGPAPQDMTVQARTRSVRGGALARSVGR